MSLVDRGFFSVNSISEIERLSLEYLMPCTRTSRVKDSLRKFVAKTLGPISKSDMMNSDRATVQYHMIIAEKKRVRKESGWGAKNGDKKGRCARRSIHCVCHQCPVDGCRGIFQKVDHRDMLQTGRECQGKIVRQQ